MEPADANDQFPESFPDGPTCHLVKVGGQWIASIYEQRVKMARHRSGDPKAAVQRAVINYCTGDRDGLGPLPDPRPATEMDESKRDFQPDTLKDDDTDGSEADDD